MAKAKRKPKPRKRATHVIDAPRGSSLYNGILIDRKAKMMCGKPLYYENGKRGYVGGKPDQPLFDRETTVSIDTATANSGWVKPCKRCFFLAKLTPEERAEEYLKEENAKQAALSKLQAKAAEAKKVALAELAIRVDQARADALVCLDVWERESAMLSRCRCVVRLGADDDATQKTYAEIRCNLRERHEGPCRRQRANEPEHVDLAAVLEVAIELYKSEHRSGGNKLIVMVPGSRRCRSCGWRGDVPDGNGPDNPDSCPDCGETRTAVLTGVGLDEPTKASPKHIACRFCRTILARDQKPFRDYTHAFFNALGVEVSRKSEAVVDVWEHTMLCGLRYLIDQKPTAQDDTPLNPTALPATSFVLEHGQ